MRRSSSTYLFAAQAARRLAWPLAAGLLAAGLAAGLAASASASGKATQAQGSAALSIVTQKVKPHGIALVGVHAVGEGRCVLGLSGSSRQAGPFTAKVKRPYVTWRWRVPAHSPARIWSAQVTCRLSGQAFHLHAHIAVHGGKPAGRRFVTPKSMRVIFSSHTPVGSIKVGKQGVVGGKGGAGCTLDSHGYCVGYCTAYVGDRRPDLNHLGNATDWYANAKKRGIPEGKKPVKGAAAWWSGSDPHINSGGYGHIAYVESVSATTVTVSEMNYTAWDVVDKRTISLSDPAAPQGYIYGGPAGKGPDTKPPTTPTGLHSTSSSPSSISVAWNASTDNVKVAGYFVYLNGSHVADATSTSAAVKGLLCAHSYTFGVNAYDAAGNHSGTPSITASTAACPTDQTPPSTPTNLHVTGKSRTGLSLAWNPSTDNVSVSGYFVYLNGTHVANESGTTATLGSLRCGHSYTVGVNAYDEASNHSGTTSISASTSACPTGTIITNSGDSPCLDLHNGPNHTDTVIGCIPDGTKISIDCTATGNAVTGPYGSTTLWDHTNWSGKSGYVTDAYVYTGTSGAVSPKC